MEALDGDSLALWNSAGVPTLWNEDSPAFGGILPFENRITHVPVWIALAVRPGESQNSDSLPLSCPISLPSSPSVSVSTQMFDWVQVTLAMFSSHHYPVTSLVISPEGTPSLSLQYRCAENFPNL